MSRLRVGLLVNPSAARGSAQRTGRQVAHLLRLAGISVVEVSGSSVHVARARAQQVLDTLTALVVVGGDGTVSLGAELVAGTPVRLGVVPAGSGNDFARALGIPTDSPEAAVKHLLRSLSRPVVTVDALEMTSLDEDVPPHRSLALGSVALGFDAMVNARANASRRGPRTRYAVAALRELPHFTPIPFRLTVDGQEPRDVDATVLTVTNTGMFGGGMRLSPQSRPDDGVAELVTVTTARKRVLARNLRRVFRGAHTGVEGFHVEPVHELTVELRDTRMLRAHSDGEGRALLPVQVRVLPGVVRVLTLAPSMGANDR
ncbi:diacylglycerol kinase family lipid kinase [Brachybacterium sp. EF45031]|uniref:diacylglycerol/lipid kinase family protein n=1 Tax=Brachybacterium sillae TaxID=2810536 RepID=UPI00217DCA9F|nr:diacylglycerol kinase family protein [Brachybacterium sillae]MCS6710663.1 diacylglycerol kinase family lipid kinase [Brachybacterium sillae]